MSRASNWVGENRDMSPDRNNRYHLDSVGLQIGLGPLQLIGVSIDQEYGNIRSVGPGRLHTKKRVFQNRFKEDSIQQTVDGIPIRKVYAANINIEVQRTEIFNLFKTYGSINNMYMGVSKNDNLKQFAFITFIDPKDASRVLHQHKVTDSKGRTIYVSAADSWHQPIEGPDGNIVWKRSKAQARLEDESEEEDQASGPVDDQEPLVEVNQEGLNTLNDDCLLHIFSFLSFKEITGVERVCRRWQALSYRVWKCLHELNFNTAPFDNMDKSTSALEQYLKRCGESLTLLDLTTKSHSFNDKTLAVIAKYCSNLEVLRVANISVGNRSLALLGRCCPKLKQLTMDGCKKFSDKDLMSLLPKCHDLSHLDLSNNESISGKCFANIPGPISSLRINHCSSIDYKHLINGLQRMSDTLESLSLSACGNLLCGDVEQIVSAVPNLTSLSLCRCQPQFDFKSLVHIKQLTKLTMLNLSFNTAVNDTVLTAIVESCDELTSLHLSGSGGGCVGLVSDRGLSMLARLRKLIHLDISYLEATNNTTLKSIAARSSKLKRLICRGCPGVSDEGATQIVSMCNDLELFDLSGCNNIEETTVTTAATSVKMRTNNTPLKLIVGGTKITSLEPEREVPLLTVDMKDLSEEHLRPDFIDDMFFPPSDSDEEDDLDHLCERIGCDCDFEFDDVYDPTLFPNDFDDDSVKYFDDPEERLNWIDNFEEYDEDECWC